MLPERNHEQKYLKISFILIATFIKLLDIGVVSSMYIIISVKNPIGTCFTAYYK